MTMRQIPRLRVVAAVLHLASAAVLWTTPAPAEAQEQDGQIIVDPTTTVAAAVEIGITPESLVVADLHAEAQVILLRIAAASDQRAALAAAHQAADAAASTMSQLAEFLWAGGDDDGLPAQYQAAIAALAAAHEQLEAIRTQLVATAVEGLPPAKIDSLNTWRAAALYRVPAEFRAISRTHDEWQLLEIALRAEARSLHQGEPLDSAVAQILQEIRSEPAVLDAQARVNLYLEATETLFTQPPPPGT